VQEGARGSTRSGRVTKQAVQKKQGELTEKSKTESRTKTVTGKRRKRMTQNSEQQSVLE
jgi:hypothetical protein